MRAAVLDQIGSPLRIADLQLDAAGAGEVLVRIEAAGVCHSDLHYMTGDLAARLPIVLGHEGAGIVEAVGPGTGNRVAVGDRVGAALATALRRVRCVRRRQSGAVPLRPRLRHDQRTHGRHEPVARR